MWPLSSLLAAAMIASLACSAAAQHDAHSRYLAELGLEDVYAEFLLDELEHSGSVKRTEIAQRLAEVYLDLLEEDVPQTERQQWAERAATLLRIVPEADSPELRLGLAQAAYLKAEESAERNVLLLADEREIAEASRILREVGPLFVSLAQEAHQRVERLERELSKQLEREEEDEVAAELAEARRTRSISFYYAGWSSYYAAELGNQPGAAEQALRHFGWILGARDGSAATVDQLQPTLLRFEHVARSAVGAAMACSMTGRSIEARAWLDAVARSTEAPEQVRESIPSRLVRVLAQAGAWPDVETIARRGLAREEPDPVFARLVCVLTLDHLDGPGGRHRQLVQRLATDAVASLVSAGEIAHVTDLARRFGTDMLGGDGFVATYVRGIMALDEARTLAERTGKDDPRSVAALLEAAQVLTAATSASDAQRFPREQAQALFEAGVALYEAGKLSEAGEIFERCQSIASSDELRRRASWMRVVTLDQAVEQGDSTLSESRDQAALLYLASYPASDQAAQLALRPSTARLLTEGQAVEILLAVPASAPSYAAARRRAAALLYRRYRGATPIERPVVADQFLALAEELIAQDSAELRGGSAQAAADLGEAIVLNARRIADVAMAVEPPQVERAVFAIETIERVSAYAGTNLGELEAELLFRRLQIASAEGRLEAASALADRLQQTGGPYAETAARVLYRDSVRDWLGAEADEQAARRVVRYGTAIESSLETQIEARAGVLRTVARAADSLAGTPDAERFRAIGIASREELLRLNRADDESLRALARAYGQNNQPDRSAETWLTVLQRADPQSDGWYEARLASIRQLEESDPAAARDAAAQFRALHPDLGPQRFREDFRALLSRLLGEGPE